MIRRFASASRTTIPASFPTKSATKRFAPPENITIISQSHFVPYNPDTVNQQPDGCFRQIYTGQLTVTLRRLVLPFSAFPFAPILFLSYNAMVGNYHPPLTYITCTLHHQNNLNHVGVGACFIPLTALYLLKRIYVTEIREVDTSTPSTGKNTYSYPLVLVTEPLFRAIKENACLPSHIKYNSGKMLVWSLGNGLFSKAFFVDEGDMQAIDESARKLWMTVRQNALAEEQETNKWSLTGQTNYMKVMGTVVGFSALTGGALALFHLD